MTRFTCLTIYEQRYSKITTATNGRAMGVDVLVALAATQTYYQLGRSLNSFHFPWPPNYSSQTMAPDHGHQTMAPQLWLTKFGSQTAAILCDPTTVALICGRQTMCPKNMAPWSPPLPHLVLARQLLGGYPAFSKQRKQLKSRNLMSHNQDLFVCIFFILCSRRSFNSYVQDRAYQIW